MELGKKIAYYRKNLNITQDALAKQLGISNQAVSKWETDQSCPDVELLPKLADIFGISLDELFEREWTAASGECEQAAENTEKTALLTLGTAGLQLPWGDDGKLRAVLFVGHQLVRKSDAEGKYSEICKEIKLNINGAVLNVESYFNVCCGDVCGNVTAGRDITCGDIEGFVSSGKNVTCTEVNGNISAGSSVASADVTGDVSAGSSVECGDVGGNVSAGANVYCRDVEGDVSAGSKVECGDVDGNVKAGGNVNCGDVEGNVTAEKSVDCGGVNGRVRAGGKVNEGDMEE